MRQVWRHMLPFLLEEEGALRYVIDVLCYLPNSLMCSTAYNRYASAAAAHLLCQGILSCQGFRRQDGGMHVRLAGGCRSLVL